MVGQGKINNKGIKILLGICGGHFNLHIILKTKTLKAKTSSLQTTAVRQALKSEEFLTVVMGAPVSQ